MRPSEDPQSDKYPDRTFYAGKWRTPEQAEKAKIRMTSYATIHRKNKDLPHCNPDIPHPGMVFQGCQWMSPESAARQKAAQGEWKLAKRADPEYMQVQAEKARKRYWSDPVGHRQRSVLWTLDNPDKAIWHNIQTKAKARLRRREELYGEQRQGS